MPVLNIQISDVKQKQDIVSFIATADDKVIKRTLNRADIDNWTDFATWLINQKPDFELLPDKEKNLSVVFHQEIFTDPETGLELTVNVVDNVVVT